MGFCGGNQNLSIHIQNAKNYNIKWLKECVVAVAKQKQLRRFSRQCLGDYVCDLDWPPIRVARAAASTRSPTIYFS